MFRRWIPILFKGRLARHCYSVCELAAAMCKANAAMQLNIAESYSIDQKHLKYAVYDFLNAWV